MEEYYLWRGWVLIFDSCLTETLELGDTSGQTAPWFNLVFLAVEP